MDEPTPEPAPFASPIIVALTAPVASAFDRTVAAFRAEGLQLERADRESGEVRSVGVLSDTLAESGAVPSRVQHEHFYQATVEAAERGSRVVLSVSARSHTRTPDGTQTSPEAEMQECQPAPTAEGSQAFASCQQQMRRLKTRLDALARRVQSGAG